MDGDRISGEQTQVLIIGSGFAGLCMAIQLTRLGRRDFLILEAAPAVGGTWRDNTYPGCACDIPSHLYSFSFEPRASWSRMYPSQAEILDYLQHCVARYQLAARLRTGAAVLEARFDEASASWQVQCADGRRFAAPVLVSGMGGLSRPAYPTIEGLSEFAGPAFHSARWDHSLDLTGRHVAVIGTGASAIQFVPQIAPQVASLTLFQRTPPWIMPKLDRPLSDRERALFARLPWAMKLFRQRIYLRQEALALGFVVKPSLMARVEKMAREHLERQVPDSLLRDRITPDYRIGCKRILISNDYLPALTRPNVAVVTTPIARVSSDAVVDRSGQSHRADVLIHATGFRATDLLSPVRVYGAGGRELSEAWTSGAQAYYGLTVSGFPNLFLLVGPNTGLGHNSIIFMIESQVNYVLSALALLRRSGARSLEVRAEVEQRFNTDLQERMARTIWKSGCRSWYLDANGKNVTLWPGFTFSYWMRTRSLERTDYRLN